MAQKYIEGDIVMYNNKVMVVKEPRDGNHFDLSCPKEGLVYCLVDIDEINPIPLTPEILEKNGWKFLKHHERNSYDDVSWDSYHKLAETNISLIFYQEEEAFFSFLYAQEISEKPIRYIHQLQHLLFGLGLNSEMEV